MWVWRWPVTSWGGMLHRMFSKKHHCPSDDIEMEGTADPFASRKPSLKQLSTANALSGKISKPRDAVVRTVRLVGKFFDTNIAPHKATSPHLKTMPYLATKHGPWIKNPKPMRLAPTRFRKSMKKFRLPLRGLGERWVAHSCDKWATITKQSLPNFIVHSHLGTIFIKSVDATEYIKL